ncbi:sensor domain-containing protein [Homoserinibacter gongjuensis]|nr:sensor domain-containing protein [Homoserinibacter gongjuensis]
MSTTRRGYGRYWLGLLPELGFLLPLLPVTIVGLSVLLTLFWTGVGMIPIVVGVFLVLAALFVARGFGIFELARLRGALFPAITPPRWDRTMRQGSALSKLLAPLVDGHYWLYLLHGSLVNPIVGIVSWSITISWLAVAVSGSPTRSSRCGFPRATGWRFCSICLRRAASSCPTSWRARRSTAPWCSSSARSSC